MFDFGFHASISLGQKDQLGYGGYDGPIIVIYGTKDWVYRLDSKSAEKIINENKYEESKIYLVDDSEHCVMCDKNEEICEIIIDALEGKSHAKKFKYFVETL